MKKRENDQRFDSWKEIADYLGRDVRTVVRWEKERGLPVHRLPGGLRRPVFALKDEIAAWLQEQGPDADITQPQHSADSSHAPEVAAIPSGSGRGRSWELKRLAIIACVSAAALLVWGFLESNGSPPFPKPALPTTISFAGSGSPLFFRSTVVSTGVQPYLPILADLNHDGKLDIVYSASPAAVIGVVLGNGDGSFQAPRLYQGCAASSGLALTDVNNDGHLDVAAACFTGNVVAIFMGNGHGTLSPPKMVAVPRGPRFLSAGDADGDGWPDLLVTSTGEGAVTLLLNRQGVFHAQHLGEIPQSVVPAFADVNQDGRYDIVAASAAERELTLVVYQADGKKTSRKLRPFPPPQTPFRSLHAVDLDGDGILDLASTDWGRAVWVSRGLGKGAFSDFVAVSPDQMASYVVTFADLDADGRMDMVATDRRTDQLSLLRGRGNLTFEDPERAFIGIFPFLSAVADLNGDGLPDILMRVGFSEHYVVLLAERREPLHPKSPPSGSQPKRAL